MKVQMEPAYRWECPRCGVENFVASERVAFEDEDHEREVRAELGVKSGEEGEVVEAPDRVECRVCEGSWETSFGP